MTGNLVSPVDDVVELPITDELDLHAFSPCDAKSLVGDYLAQCRSRKILRVRVIHGKGTGALRATVHATLARLPWVREYSLAQADHGQWGATIVTLLPPDDHGPRWGPPR